MPKFSINLAQASNKGLVRKNNEDRTAIDSENSIAILADGVGGQSSGEVASAMAVNILMLDFKNIVIAQDSMLNAKAISTALSESVIACSKQITNIAKTQPQYKNMATTIVGALFKDDNVAFVHVGDSRLYRFRNGTLAQLTKDHSLYQHTLDTQTANNQTDYINVPKNIITQALGLDREITPSCSFSQTQPGDIYLLCSDGLSDLANEEEISNAISSFTTDSLSDNAEKLIQLALAKGGTDNVSVVIAEISSAIEKPSFLAKLKKVLTG